MSEAKHTPGPWTHRSRDYDDWGLVRAADGYPVASANVSARVPERGLHRVWTKGGFPEPAEITANARLIAAAPELLAACEEMVRVFEQGCVDRGYKDERNWIDEARDKLDDAIIKAKGES